MLAIQEANVFTTLKLFGLLPYKLVAHMLIAPIWVQLLRANIILAVILICKQPKHGQVEVVEVHAHLLVQLDSVALFPLVDLK